MEKHQQGRAQEPFGFDCVISGVMGIICDVCTPSSLLSLRATSSAIRNSVDSRWGTLSKLREHVLNMSMTHEELCRAMGRSELSVEELSMLLRIVRSPLRTQSVIPDERVVAAFFNCLVRSGFIKLVDAHGVYTTTTTIMQEGEFLEAESTVWHGYRVEHADQRGWIPIYFCYSEEEADDAAVAAELFDLCSDVYTVLSLEPYKYSAERNVWLYTMQGDLFLHQHQMKLRMTQHGEDTKKASCHALLMQAEKRYEAALELSTTELFPCHPHRLALAANYSILSYELLRDRERGVHFAKSSFDEALDGMDCSCCGDEGRECFLQMKLLNRNLTRWRQQMEEDS
jgi:hypothetical protein